MRKRKCGKIFAAWILAALMLASVCLPFGAVLAAEQTGSMEMRLPADSGNVEITLYAVATYQDGVYRLTENFADSKLEIPQDLNDAQRVQEVVDGLMAFVRNRGISGTAAKPDSNGIVKFTGLAPALYMAAQTAGEREIDIQTSLVPIPYLEEGGTVTYDAVIFPKYTYPMYSITVEKSLVDLADMPVFARDGVFYVALFSDMAHTQRVSPVLPIYFHGESTSSVTFTNLSKGKTYYVGETDEAGNFIGDELNGANEELYYFPVYPDDTSVSVDEETGETIYYFENAFTIIPDGFYYRGEVTVTKKVLKGTEEYNTDEVYYCAVFLDEECTERMGDVIQLEMDGGSETSVTVPVDIGNSPDTVLTYYIRETDENGVPLENSEELGFTVQQDKEEVLLSYQDNKDEVVITNIYEDEEPTPSPSKAPTPQITSGVTPGGNTPPSTQPSPRTGDDTNIALYVILLLGAAAAGLTVFLRKRENH